MDVFDGAYSSSFPTYAHKRDVSTDPSANLYCFRIYALDCAGLDARSVGSGGILYGLLLVCAAFERTSVR